MAKSLMEEAFDGTLLHPNWTPSPTVGTFSEVSFLLRGGGFNSTCSIWYSACRYFNKEILSLLSPGFHVLERLSANRFTTDGIQLASVRIPYNYNMYLSFRSSLIIFFEKSTIELRAATTTWIFSCNTVLLTWRSDS